MELGCSELREQHGDYLDGLLPAWTAAAVQLHLSWCDECARYDRIIRKAMGLVRELPVIEPSEDFEQRLQHRLFHVQDERLLSGQRPASGLGVAVAVAGVIALLAWSPVMLAERQGERAAPARVADAGTEGGRAEAMPLPAARPLGSALEEWPGQDLRAVLMAGASSTAVFPGPYSPLIVTPPVHGRNAVRTVSSEYRTLE